MDKIHQLLKQKGMSFMDYDIAKMIIELGELSGARKEVENLLIHLIDNAYKSGYKDALDKTEKIIKKNSRLW